jgi:hypothetical protein
MGSEHDPANAKGKGAFEYSYGYRNTANRFRDIMAPPDCEQGCPRVPYFSNPRVRYQGEPLGIDNSADNTRSLNATRCTVQHFRLAIK